MDPATRSVLSLARSVLGELDLNVVLERVLEASRELTGARYAALGVLDETRGELARFLTLGIDEATRREIGPLPRGRGLLGELITDPVPLRLVDVDCHPRSYGFPVGHPPMRSFLGVPLLVGEEPYGNLYLTDKQRAAEFTAEGRGGGRAPCGVRRCRDRPCASLHGFRAAPRRVPANRQRVGGHDRDRAGARRPDRPEDDSGACGQARTCAGVRSSARDRARAR